MSKTAKIAFGLTLVFGNWTSGQERPAMSVAAGNDIQLPAGARGPYRPESLHTNNSAASSSFQFEEFAQRPSVGQPEELEGAKIIARVGDEVILAGDLLGQVNQFLHAKIQEIPPEQRSQLDPQIVAKQRWTLIRQLLPQVIEGKLVYLDFIRSIPKERIPELQDSLYRAFDEQQLPVLIERAQVKTAADLDQRLRSFGSSLDQQRRTFAEQLAAVQWKNRHGTSRKEITHDDMLAYYREHRDQFRIQAKARWEQLSSYDSQTASRSASHKKVADMGNEVFRGASFPAVARRSSDGPTAAMGGRYDWTNQGSLRSDVLDEAIFSLPTGRLSEILEDEDGCHIVRVIERQDESYVSFTEAQESIRQEIQAQREKAAEQQYVEDLRSKYPVWTLFDEETSASP